MHDLSNKEKLELTAQNHISDEYNYLKVDPKKFREKIFLEQLDHYENIKARIYMETQNKLKAVTAQKLNNGMDLRALFQ